MVSDSADEATGTKCTWSFDILVLDSFTRPFCQGVQDAILEAGSNLVSILGNVRYQLQPVDVAVIKPF